VSDNHDKVPSDGRRTGWFGLLINKEVGMMQKELRTPVAFAILTMAEVKAAVDGFNNGESNVFEALENIVVAVEAYRGAALPRLKAG